MIFGKTINNWATMPATSAKNEDYQLDLEYIGEGYNGDFDPDDAEDAPLLRFTLVDIRGGDWLPVDDCSHCTLCPADTTSVEDRQAIAEYMLEKFLEADPETWPHISEKLTYISGRGDIAK